MKKIGLLTINDFNNYGNRLQNYAIQYHLKKMGCEVITLKNDMFSNSKKYYFIKKLKYYKYEGTFDKNEKRKCKFIEFNKNINFSDKKITAYSKDDAYDYYITGSDQVWNPTIGRFKEVDLLSFARNQKKIAFSASFSIDEMPIKYKHNGKKFLRSFKNISVRENAGKKIIEDLTGRTDVEVLVDPTMLLTAEEWDKVSKKPEMLKTDKYILNYFLGNLSEEKQEEINKIANENNCEVINILDKNSPFYECGPSEFLWLEKNAYLICTDSFHSSVFAILYNRPFIIFDREQDGLVSMNSRLDTLISKFKLKDRKFNETITENNLNHDYSEAYEILEKERKKSKEFLEKSLDLN